jgi:periplasmic divalent cation tolerance protein
MRRFLVGRPGAGLRRRDDAFADSFFATRKKQYTNSRESTRPMIDCLVVLTTMPADARAEALARTLVEERLAACVNVHAPMTSTYRWRGAVEVDAERQLVIKTVRDRLAALEARLRSLHPYEVPEFVVLSGQAADDYAGWMGDAVSTGGS